MQFPTYHLLETPKQQHQIGSVIETSGLHYCNGGTIFLKDVHRIQMKQDTTKTIVSGQSMPLL